MFDACSMLQNAYTGENGTSILLGSQGRWCFRLVWEWKFLLTLTDHFANLMQNHISGKQP